MGKLIRDFNAPEPFSEEGGTQRSVEMNKQVDIWFSVHAITARLNPIKSIPSPAPPNGIQNRPEPSSGLEVLETENFRMQCFNTMTGTKFLLFTDTTQTNVDVTIRKIYDLYADYVMKNPFYSLEMPIRCDMFERKLSSYIREMNNR